MKSSNNKGLKKGIVCLFIFSVVLGITGTSLMAQCRTYAKNTCESQLDDYLLNGRMYGGYMIQGQNTELYVVLSAGQKYRLVGCTKESLGQLWIQIIDGKGHVIFDNTEYDLVQNWDFTVKSTQEFKIRTFIPEPKGKTEQKMRDCSLMLIGSKGSS
ncbi:MAG: hypothetical protein RIC15_09005 [Vicingaceae bacterium]